MMKYKFNFRLMRNISNTIFYANILLTFLGCTSQSINETRNYIIDKKNGKIVLAYKAFEDFLDSDKSWGSYKSIFLSPYPSIQKVHQRQIEWGSLDTVTFPNKVTDYNKEDFEEFISRFDVSTIDFLYDSTIEKGNKILPPKNAKETDLCFFLPYSGGCFVIPEDSLNTIYISLYINPNEFKKIMVHEYAHILHFDKCPKEPLTLAREVVYEGMAVYLTNLIIEDIEPEKSVPFMTEESFKWCMENEELIKDSIKLDLADTTMRLFKRYISDGSWAEPPKGFVAKTAYFTGYRIIENCIAKGMSLEDICSLESEKVIKESEYFK